MIDNLVSSICNDNIFILYNLNISNVFSKISLLFFIPYPISEILEISVIVDSNVSSSVVSKCCSLLKLFKCIVKLISNSSDLDINKNDIFEGRNIEKDNECLISSKLKDIYNYQSSGIF